MDKDLIEVAALGRPFQLGMLYDMSKNEVLPATTLWANLQKSKHAVPCKHSKCRIITADTINDKASALQLDGSLKISLLTGLVTESGAARFFSDTKKSLTQQRLTMQYHTTTTKVDINRLIKQRVSHPEVLVNSTATHVVTAVLYGADVFFVFDRDISEENIDQVEEELKRSQKILETLCNSIDEGSPLSIEQSEMVPLEKFRCTCYGDLKLPAHPSTIHDVFNICKRISKKLGHKNEHAVPLTVWLYPLGKLDVKFAKPLRALKSNLISNTTDIFEQFSMIEMKCNDLKENKVPKTFPATKRKILELNDHCKQYKEKLFKELESLLPQVHKSVKDEDTFFQLLKNHEDSPFGSHTITQWISDKEREFATVKSFLQQLEKIGLCVNNNLEDVFTDLSVDTVVCFTFTSIDQPELLIAQMSNYLKLKTMTHKSTESLTPQSSWLNSKVRTEMKEKLKLLDHMRNSMTSDHIVFTVSSEHHKEHPGACIMVYENGSEEGFCFVPPSKPVCSCTYTASHDGIRVKLSSACNATVEHRLEYKMKHEQEWNSQSVELNQNEVDLTELKPDTVYEIRCVAVGKLGFTVNSDIITAQSTNGVGPPTEVRTEGSLFEKNKLEFAPDLSCGATSRDAVDQIVLLFGNMSAVHFGPENILLGDKPLSLDNLTLAIIPRSCTLFGKNIAVINLLGLREAELSMSTVNHVVNERMKEIHAILYVVEMGQLTDADKMGLEWLEQVFGDRVFQLLIVLFTSEKDESPHKIISNLRNNPTLQQLVAKCKGRYHVCIKNMNNQSEIRTLLEKINHLVSENKHRSSTNPNHKPREMHHVGRSQQDNLQNTEHITQITECSSDNSTLVTEKRTEKEDTQKEDGPAKHESSETDGIRNIKQLFKRLMDDSKNELTTADCLEIKMSSLQYQEPKREKELVLNFLEKILMMNYQARHIYIKEDTKLPHETKPQLQVAVNKNTSFQDFLSKETGQKPGINKQSHIHPMDVQMAVFHHADHFLRQYMMTKLSQCQYAVPLLVPHPFRKEIEFPLWALRQIKKSWKSVDSHGNITSQSMPIYQAETPMVAFFKIGSVSSSKSQLMNYLINEKHNIFFHRHCPGSSRTRLLLDGVVEIAWYCPSGKSTDKFTDCIAFCNLHGDAEEMETPRKILTEMASLIIVILESENSSAILKEIFLSSTPLIVILTEDSSSLTEYRKRKYKMGLKDRSQSDILEELFVVLKECLSESTFSFNLEALAKKEGISVDENHDECQKGKTAANQIMDLLKDMELPKIKEKYLPCQGALLHELSQKIKDLHNLQTEQLELSKSTIQSQILQIREKQKACGFSDLMRLFVANLRSLEVQEKMYFLNWVGVLLDGMTSVELTKLCNEYNEKWADVQALKKSREKLDQLSTEQEELEKMSEKLKVATFGLEHIFREMGQIYEANVSVSQNMRRNEDYSYLPEQAAKLMISGYPMELMNGDVANVPLQWVSAVVDELIKILGDQRVFVLSVLGVQSTGKSTLLNAMFGLQFAVSAGRCTRGAFMQLIRVSKEMKSELMFDYILVVDTEGLRSQELTEITRDHDNKLATFVVGLGSMTLINVFGENLAEMQDILQIVVQALMRMKKVRLSPSCMFVHQNVGDITAGEKNVEGRKRLQEKLDEMTKLAAKEEVYDAECFSDIIEFDIQKDVRYFAQLWEGSPPMAPPNPCYSENVQELKKTILEHAKKNSGVNLSQLKARVHDLWQALLNENFVFSFKNTLEIAVYRKLEFHYGKWAWNLRSAMLKTETKWQNKIENNVLHEVDEKTLESELTETINNVQRLMTEIFEKDKDKDILIQWRASFQIKIKELQESIVRDTKRKLNEVLKLRNAQKMIDSQRTHHENTLLEKSKELALNLKIMKLNDEDLEKEFDSVWEQWVKDVTKDMSPIKDTDISRDMTKVLGEIYERSLVDKQRESGEYRGIFSIIDYSAYIVSKRHYIREKVNEFINYCFKKTKEANEKTKVFVEDILIQTDEIIKSKPVARMGYNSSYIQELAMHINTKVKEHEKNIPEYSVKNEFAVDLSLCVCEKAAVKFTQQHEMFKEANDPLVYLQKKKQEYYSIFKKQCQGATSTAIFGEIICWKLNEPIQQSVQKKTAIDLANEMMTNCQAFSGNRSKLEKHILQSLAIEEDFEEFMRYIYRPRTFFKKFIKKEASKYIRAEYNNTVKSTIENNFQSIQEQLLTAAQHATKMTKKNNESTEIVVYNEFTETDKTSTGSANLWLKHFSHCLSEQLKFTVQDFAGLTCNDITDPELLEKMVKKELKTMISEITSLTCEEPFDSNMWIHEIRPEEILDKHLCDCCWERCPFCRAICTNTIEGHPGDHSVPFHRSTGLNGRHYRGTKNLTNHFCTTAVSSNCRFYPDHYSEESIPYKNYRKGGPKYANWSITPDSAELPYWTWFMCKFQTELEEYYEKTFSGKGKIPDEWKKCKKDDAIKSLEKYMYGLPAVPSINY